MAKEQRWSRNVSKKPKAGTRPIVGGDALEGLKRRAEKLGLIIHASGAQAAEGKRKEKRQK